MYSLLVHWEQGAWDQQRVLLDEDRYLEYTSQALTDRFKSFDDKVLNQLKALPAVFAYEGACRSSSPRWMDRVR